MPHYWPVRRHWASRNSAAAGSRRCNNKLVVAGQVSGKGPGSDYEFRFSQKRNSARIQPIPNKVDLSVIDPG